MYLLDFYYIHMSTAYRCPNSYLETLPCLYYSQKVNEVTKQVLLLGDADLATHLLCMCPARWQTQHKLTKNTTLVSIRALLTVLDNIETMSIWTTCA